MLLYAVCRVRVEFRFNSICNHTNDEEIIGVPPSLRFIFPYLTATVSSRRLGVVIIIRTCRDTRISSK